MHRGRVEGDGGRDEGMDGGKMGREGRVVDVAREGGKAKKKGTETEQREKGEWKTI